MSSARAIKSQSSRLTFVTTISLTLFVLVSARTKSFHSYHRSERTVIVDTIVIMPLAKLWSLTTVDGKLLLKIGDDVFTRYGALSQIQNGSQDKPNHIRVINTVVIIACFRRKCRFPSTLLSLSGGPNELRACHEGSNFYTL